MKAVVNITLENGSMTYAANVPNTELIAMLEVAKAMAIRQALGGVGQAVAEPGGPAGNSRRVPGLQVRRLDSGSPAIGR